MKIFHNIMQEEQGVTLGDLLKDKFKNFKFE